MLPFWSTKSTAVAPLNPDPVSVTLEFPEISPAEGVTALTTS